MANLAVVTAVRRLGWPAILERIAWGSLLALALVCVFEFRRPWLPAGPLSLTNVELLLFVALGCWLLARAAEGRLPSVPRPVALPAAAWLAVCAASAVLAPANRAEALKFTARLAGGALLGWACYDLACSTARPHRLAQAMGLAGAAVAAVGLLEAAGLAGLAEALLAFREGAYYVGNLLRISASLPYPNITAMVLELTLPLLLAWLLTTPARWLRPVLAASLAAGLAVLVLALSRAGLGSLLAALAGASALAAWRGRWRLAWAGAATMGLLGVFIATVATVNAGLAWRVSGGEEADWYRAGYTAPASLSLEPGEVQTVRVSVLNNSPMAWPAEGRAPVQLNYRVLGGGQANPLEGPYVPLGADLAPGAAAQLDVPVIAPETPGDYTLEWDLVQVGYTRFSWKGNPPGRTTLTVGGSTPVEAKAEPPQNVRLVPASSEAAPPQLPRAALWALAWDMTLARPLLGVGPDNFRHLYGPWAGLARWDERLHTNSLYLEWLVDTGVLGAAAFLWLAGSLALTAARPWLRSQSRPAEVWQWALLAALAAWFVHGIFDTFLAFTATYVLFWMGAGLAAAYAHRSA